MTNAKTIIVYRPAAGNDLITKWLNRLRDPTTRRRIFKRLRLEQGHYGDFKPVGGGVNELCFSFGAGYRVYFAEDGETLVVLLCAGDKSS